MLYKNKVNAQELYREWVKRPDEYIVNMKRYIEYFTFELYSFLTLHINVISNAYILYYVLVIKRIKIRINNLSFDAKRYIKIM